MLTREHAEHEKTHSETLSSWPVSVVDAAECRLRRSGYPSLCSVSCQHHQGVLILTGRLTTHYLKQMAQTVVVGLEEVEEIVNRIEVLGPTE
jgi:osmotically-inducible protein OsmY